MLVLSSISQAELLKDNEENFDKYFGASQSKRSF